MSARDVARAIDALRRGWPIAIRGAGEPVGLLAIETADSGRMKAFDPEGESPILLSAGRAATLKLANQLEAAIPDSPVLVERTFWIDFDCAVALADPQLDMATPMKGPFRAIHVDDRDVMAAALSLARTAGVLPAFFVGKAPDEIDDRSVRLGVERVHREVAPLGVRLPVAPERHAGTAAVRLDIGPERRNLIRLSACDHRHGSMLDARRYSLETGRLCPLHRLFRQRRRGDVDVGDRGAEERVADRAAGDPCLFALLRQCLEQPLELFPRKPVGAAGQRLRPPFRAHA